MRGGREMSGIWMHDVKSIVNKKLKKNTPLNVSEPLLIFFFCKSCCGIEH